MDAPFRITEQLVRVLDVFLDDPTGNHYGFRIAKDAAIQTGTLYPIMARLEDAGWLTGRWQDEDNTRGPRKRLYTLTPEGLNRAPAVVASRAKIPQRRTRGHLRPAFGFGAQLGATP